MKIFKATRSFGKRENTFAFTELRNEINIEEGEREDDDEDSHDSSSSETSDSDSENAEEEGQDIMIQGYLSDENDHNVKKNMRHYS